MEGDFHFLRPEWFLVGPVLLWIVFLLSRRSTGTEAWKAVCEPVIYYLTLLLGRERIPSKVPWILLGVRVVLGGPGLSGSNVVKATTTGISGSVGVGNRLGSFAINGCGGCSSLSINPRETQSH